MPNIIEVGRWGLNPAYVREYEVTRSPSGDGSIARVVVTMGDGRKAREVVLDGPDAETFHRMIGVHVTNRTGP